MAGKEHASGPHLHTVRVRFADCDQAGHANTVAYMAYLEAAREEMLFATGMLKPTVDARELPIITAKVWIEYLGETFYGDELEIRTRVARLGTKSFELDHEVVRAGEEDVLTRGGCVLIRYDYGNKASTPLTGEEREGLGRYA